MTNRTFLGLWGLRELHLENNRLQTLSADIWAESQELEELYLHNNLLRSVHNATFAQLSRLRVLTLHGNRLTSLDLDYAVLETLKAVTLARNPWVCSCELSLTFYRVSELVSQRVGQVSCTDTTDTQHHILTYHSSCKDLDVQAVASKAASSPFLILLVSTTAGVLVVLGVSVALVLKRNSITRWMDAKSSAATKVDDHSQYSPMIKLPAVEARRAATTVVPSMNDYSAYLHYCLADDDYVKGVLAPKLESVDRKYKICLHQRDLPQACTVGQAISHAVAHSRCLLILASPAYFLSNIPSYELQMILSEVLPRYTSYPVIVAVSQASISEVKARFRQIVGCQSDTWSYLEVSDILFYDRVVSLVGGTESSSSVSSCSTKSTAASTLPARVMPGPPRVIANPLDRLTGESIYCSVVDPASEGEEPTYQTVYADQTLYIDRNLELVQGRRPMPSRFRTLQ